MRTIKVKLANPERRVWDPTRAGYLTGKAVSQVPDVTYWRRMVKDGTLAIVESKDEPKGDAKARGDDAKGTSQKHPTAPAPVKVTKHESK